MQPNVNVDLSQCETIACECGNMFFQNAVILKRIPGLQVGQSQDVQYPMPILLCAACGKPLVPGAPIKEQNTSSLIM